MWVERAPAVFTIACLYKGICFRCRLSTGCTVLAAACLQAVLFSLQLVYRSSPDATIRVDWDFFLKYSLSVYESYRFTAACLQAKLFPLQLVYRLRCFHCSLSTGYAVSTAACLQAKLFSADMDCEALSKK